MVQAAADADILIFVVPHQFISKICGQLKGHLKANAIGVSLIKVLEQLPAVGGGGAANCCGVRVGEERRKENGRRWPRVFWRGEELFWGG